MVLWYQQYGHFGILPFKLTELGQKLIFVGKSHGILGCNLTTERKKTTQNKSVFLSQRIYKRPDMAIDCSKL